MKNSIRKRKEPASLKEPIQPKKKPFTVNKPIKEKAHSFEKSEEKKDLSFYLNQNLFLLEHEVAFFNFAIQEITDLIKQTGKKP